MSSKSYLRRRGCERKIPYETSAEATRHLTDGLHVYHCAFKDHYHVGHSERTKSELMGNLLDRVEHDARQARIRRGLFKKNKKHSWRR